MLIIRLCLAPAFLSIGLSLTGCEDTTESKKKLAILQQMAAGTAVYPDFKEVSSS
jgi:hypothetical protein